MPVLPLDDVASVFPGVLDLPGQAAPSTVAEYQADLQHYLAFCHYDVERARHPDALRAWKQWMVNATRLSPHTINRRLACIKTLARLSAQELGMDAQQCYNFHLVTPVKVRALKHRLNPWAQTWLAAEEVRRLWRVPDPTTLGGLRDRALIALLASSGCRLGEAVTLLQWQIHWGHGQGYVSIVGKAHAEPRMAPLTAEAYSWLALWLKARQDAGVDVPRVFTQMRQGGKVTPKPLARQGAYHVLKAYATQIGLRHFKPHDLRRFVGNRLAEADIRQAQLALGHVNIATTTRYVRNVQRIVGLTEGVW
jgi:integrase/recombinase XerD